MNTRVELIESIGRLGLALFLGSVIGFERQWHQKMAGLGIGFLGAGVILREGINVHGLNTAATLWCSAMVGTFAGAGFWPPSLVAAGFVTGTNLLLRPLVRLINTQTVSSGDAETCYSVTLTCKSSEEAHLRSLLLPLEFGATH